jgi:hypothetical protein
MERKQRQQTVLVVLLAVLGGVFVYRYWALPSMPAAVASNVRTRTPENPAATGTAPEVRLDALKAERPTPAEGDRNPFRFKPKPAPPPPPSPRPAAPGGPGGQPPVATGPPAPPPIPLKFIGIVESPDHRQKIAVLTDGRGAPQYGKEGDTILGQYKILHIGVESIEMSYVDGRGRQTIRLTGQ